MGGLGTLGSCFFDGGRRTLSLPDKNWISGSEELGVGALITLLYVALLKGLPSCVETRWPWEAHKQSSVKIAPQDKSHILIRQRAKAGQRGEKTEIAEIHRNRFGSYVRYTAHICCSGRSFLQSSS